jgi:ATP-dependent RNA helicase DeaD
MVVLLSLKEIRMSENELSAEPSIFTAEDSRETNDPPESNASSVSEHTGSDRVSSEGRDAGVPQKQSADPIAMEPADESVRMGSGERFLETKVEREVDGGAEQPAEATRLDHPSSRFVNQSVEVDHSGEEAMDEEVEQNSLAASSDPKNGKGVASDEVSDSSEPPRQESETRPAVTRQQKTGSEHSVGDEHFTDSDQLMDRDAKGSRKANRKGKRGSLQDSQQEGSEVVFSALALSQDVLQAVAMKGYEKPTPIQAQIIPHLLDGRDVLAQSQTGTGKTAAFALPILSRISLNQRHPQVLVLAPTRELAIQVSESFSTYAACMRHLSVATIYGGQSYEPQLRQLRGGAQIVVGTPGRVMDHMRRGTLDLTGIQCLVLDEADEMLSMGFLEDVLLILEHTPEGRQIALFSATVPEAIQEIAQQHLNNPVHIRVKKKTMTADSIRHRALMLAPRDKIDALGRMIEAEETDGIIVFTKTKAATLTVAEALGRQGRSAVALNGDMPQATRERTIEQFKSGQLDILVATDVAARGLDVSRVSHVFNFDLPHDVESYIHRVGRTGRAGRAGEAIIFLSRSQRARLRTIERVTHQKIEWVGLPTTDDINQLRIKRFQGQITEVIGQHDLTLFKDLLAQYATETGKPMELIAAALAHLSQQGRPFLEKDRPQRKRHEKDRWSDEERRHGDRSQRAEGRLGAKDSRSSRAGKPKRTGRPEAGMQRYRIEVGRLDGVSPRNIVGAVANEAGIEGEFIGPITINDSYSTVDLPAGMPTDIYQSLQRTRVAGKPLRIRLQDEWRGKDSEGGGRPPRQESRRGPGKAKRQGKKNGGFNPSQAAKPAKVKKKGKKKKHRHPSA